MGVPAECKFLLVGLGENLLQLCLRLNDVLLTFFVVDAALIGISELDEMDHFFVLLVGGYHIIINTDVQQVVPEIRAAEKRALDNKKLLPGAILRSK